MARQQGFLGGRCYIVRSKDNGARSKIAFMEMEWLDWDLWELLFCCDTPDFKSCRIITNLLKLGTMMKLD